MIDGNEVCNVCDTLKEIMLIEFTNKQNKVPLLLLLQKYKKIMQYRLGSQNNSLHLDNRLHTY